MSNRPGSSITLLLACLLGSAGVVAAAGPGAAGDVGALSRTAEVNERVSAARVPFVANSGQTDPAVAYYARTFAGTVYVTRDSHIVYSLPGSAAAGGWSVTETAVGGTGGRPTPTGEAPSRTAVSHFIGNDPARWSRNAVTYDAVSLGEMWPGVDLSLRAYGKNVEKLFTVQPGADPSRIRMRVSGARSMAIDGRGALVVSTTPGDVVFTPPVAYQERHGIRQRVDVAYQVRDDEYRFGLGRYDASLPLVIDPLLQSTYLGGSGADIVYALAVHPTSGDVYAAGFTTSTNFPGTTGGAQPAKAAGQDVFVARLSADLRSLTQATYLGGDAQDTPLALAIHPTSGDVYIAGQTFSANFPGVTGGVFSTQQGNSDAFVARLSPDLQALVQATYLGGSGIANLAYALSIHPASGDVYVAGLTASATFPATAGGAQPTHAGGTYDAFVARLARDLTSLTQSSYFGGGADDRAFSLAIHPMSGDVYVSGITASTDLPGTTGGAQPANAGAMDGFVVRLGSDLTTLTQATYFGGSGDDLPNVDSLSVHPITNDVYVAGWTSSADLPGTAGGAQGANAGGLHDAFVARMTDDLTSLTQATYLGGSGDDLGQALAIHPFSGEVYLVGRTDSTNLPGTSGAIQTAVGGDRDVFVARLTANLTTLVRATYLGGNNYEAGEAIAIHPTSGDVYVGGEAGANFPGTGGGAQAANGGGAADGFVARLTAGIGAGPDPPSPPDTLITGTPSDPSSTSDATFTFLGTKPGSTFECSLDGGAFAPCATPHTYTDLPDGDHTFEVRATAAGLTDLTPASFAWTVTLSAFTVSLAQSVSEVAIPPAGKPSATLGDIEIRESKSQVLSGAGRIQITLPAPLTFVGSPAASTIVSNGIAVGAPLVESAGQVFSFAVTNPSTTGAARLLISNLSVAVPGGTPLNTLCGGSQPSNPVCVSIASTAANGLTAVPQLQIATFLLPSAGPILTGVSVTGVGDGVTTTVVLFGQNLNQINFGAGDTITFGPGITVVGTPVVNANGTVSVKIKVAVDAPVGTRNITLTHNGVSTTLTGEFKVSSPPTVTSAGTGDGTGPLLSPPNSVDVLKRQVVKIKGSGFQAPTTVPSDLLVSVSGTGITVNGVGFVSDTEIAVDVDVAGGTAGVSRKITLTNPDLGTTTSAPILAVQPAPADAPVGLAPKATTGTATVPVGPTVTAIATTPPTNPPSARTGATVTISGSGFSTTPANNLVTFAGPQNLRVVGTIVSSSATTLKIQVPPTALDGPIAVAVSGVAQSTQPLGFTITNPSLSAVTTPGGGPASGKRGDSAATVLLSGAKLHPAATVSFSSPGVSVVGTSSVDAGTLQVTVSIDANAPLGFRDVTVKNPDNASVTLAQSFEVKLDKPYDLAFALTRLPANEPPQPIALGSFLPAVEGVQATLDATGKCTGRTITPARYLLEASFTGTPPDPLPAALVFTLTSSALPGTAANEDCEPSPQPEFDFSVGEVGQAPSVGTQQFPAPATGGVYRVWLASWDWGGSVRIDVSDNPGSPDPTASATLVLPVDADNDGLPDAYENNLALNANKNGVNVLDRAKGDLNGNGVPDGQDKFSADGLTNFEKYRGVYLSAPAKGTAGSLASADHWRLGSGLRHLFVRGRGFVTDPSRPANSCGMDSLTGAPIANDPTFPCPKFQVGAAFAEFGVQIWDVTNSFNAAGTRVFPTRSLADPNKPMLDLATVTYDAKNCSGAASCDHTVKRGPRQWDFPTLGYSQFGSPRAYGGAVVLAKPFKGYFRDRPYLHQQSPAGTYLSLAPGGRPMLAPITVVCDNTSRGADDGTAQAGECVVNGKPGGDVYVPGQYNQDLSAMDINSDGCVELPFVADPTTLPTCTPSADTAAAPQATFQQIVRSVITHELGHATGINVHTSDPFDLMYMYSINWRRDGHFSPQAGALIQIHNKGQQ